MANNNIILIVTRVFEELSQTSIEFRCILKKKKMRGIFFDNDKSNEVSTREEIKNKISEVKIICVKGEDGETLQSIEEIVEIAKKIDIKILSICHPGLALEIEDVIKEYPFLSLKASFSSVGTLRPDDICQSLKAIESTTSFEEFGKKVKELEALILGQADKEKEKKTYHDWLQTKYRIINIWLPLAIDIHGLSKVIKTDPNKAEEYWTELRKDSGKFSLLLRDFKNLIKESDELKDRISGDNEVENMNEFLKRIVSEETTVSTLKESGYLNPDAGFYFPNWLGSFSKSL